MIFHVFQMRKMHGAADTKSVDESTKCTWGEATVQCVHVFGGDWLEF